ncbi:MAG: hypothetical protein ABI076_04775 [Acidobacteriaceae bacterium]
MKFVAMLRFVLEFALLPASKLFEPVVCRVFMWLCWHSRIAPRGVIPFFQFPPEVREIVYPTNAIESLNIALCFTVSRLHPNHIVDPHS